MDVYANLKSMGIEIPPVSPKGGIYTWVKQVGNLLFVSGQSCKVNGVPIHFGHVGKDCTLEQAQEAAKVCAINALSVVQDYVKDLNTIKSLVKTTVFVSSDPSFTQQHVVANGCSQFLADVFGEERGVGTRSAIGVAQLPLGMAVEVEFIFEI